MEMNVKNSMEGKDKKKMPWFSEENEYPKIDVEYTKIEWKSTQTGHVMRNNPWTTTTIEGEAEIPEENLEGTTMPGTPYPEDIG